MVKQHTRHAPLTISAARWRIVTSLGPPLLVAVVLLTGLVWLSVENLNGTVGARQAIQDHAVAVQKLLFRD